MAEESCSVTVSNPEEETVAAKMYIPSFEASVVDAIAEYKSERESETDREELPRSKAATTMTSPLFTDDGRARATVHANPLVHAELDVSFCTIVDAADE